MGGLNAHTSSNQAIHLSNYSSPNTLWLDEGTALDN